MTEQDLAEIDELVATRRRCFGTSAGEDATRSLVGKVPALVAALRAAEARAEKVEAVLLRAHEHLRVWQEAPHGSTAEMDAAVEALSVIAGHRKETAP